MTEAILSIQSLFKSFGGIPATDDVNLSVRKGGIHAIIGPNGAGKTTLIAQLSGQLKSDKGSIHFNGRNILGLSPAQRARAGLARSFQITSVFLPMTLLENVMLAVQGAQGHSYRFWSPAENDSQLIDCAMEALAIVGLDDRADQRVANVSHGEQRQLEVAMALAMQPKMLLLDEPMAGMGKEETLKMVDILSRLAGDKTILMVEHDMDAVFSLADQLSVLVNGHIIATDTVEKIRSNHDVQRAYLGDQHA
ncbi:MAG: ABC transporter ATP-binding protein [Gammaproteobacteria bacterium]